MMDVPAILKRAAESCNFERVRFNSQNIPTSISNICVLVLLGDLSSICVAASLLIKRYREQSKGSKYFIICSWPGLGELFPYADEYWSVKPEQLNVLYSKANGLVNNSDQAVGLHRSLNHFFEEVLDHTSITPFYNNGITQQFFERFGHIKRYRPSVPSFAVLGKEFNREVTKRGGNLVFIHPSKWIQRWKLGRLEYHKSPKDFWLFLAEQLIGKGFTPLVWQNFSTHDLSQNLVEKCMYITDSDIGTIMAGMRSSTCVLDVFTGVSRLAVLSRSPYISCDERNRYMGQKEYEYEDLCGGDLPREHIFSFSTIIDQEDKNVWKVNLIDRIMVKLNVLLSRVDRNNLPSTVESEQQLLYEKVRKIKSKNLGTKFVKVPKN